MFWIVIIPLGGLFLGVSAASDGMRGGMPAPGFLICAYIAMTMGGLAQVSCENPWTNWYQVLGYCGVIVAMTLVSFATLPVFRKLFGRKTKKHLRSTGDED